MEQEPNSNMNIKIDKEAKWEQVSKRIEKTTDRLELKIDPGIIETVVALNALEINTSQSCEGHMDALGGPWIDIAPVQTDDLREIKRQIDILNEKIELVEKENSESGKIDELYAEHHRLRKIESGYMLREIKKIVDLLSE